MPKEYPIINIFTSQLPKELAVRMYNEFQDRMKTVMWQVQNVERYKFLNDHIKLVEDILALSIFHRRVVASLDGALTFFRTVTQMSGATGISIGKYEFTAEEKNKLLSLTISYRQLLKKFLITQDMFEFQDTREFMRILLRLKQLWENAETNE